MQEQTATNSGVTTRETLSLAVVSLIFGILTFVLLGPIGAIVAVICGHVALSTLRAQPDRYAGKGMAVAGLTLGYTGLLLVVVAFVLVLAVWFSYSSVEQRDIGPEPATTPASTERVLPE